MAVALVALFISMGGVSYAAIQIPKNSVGTAQLKKNSVTGSKVKMNAINSAKVKDGSLLARDFKRGQLPAGAPGAQGAQGIAGPVGAPGVAGTARAHATVHAIAPRFDGPQVGFESATNPATGVYCLKPAAGSNIDVANSHAVTTMNAGSVASYSIIQVGTTDTRCPAAIPVYTYRMNPGASTSLFLDNGVAFNIIVP